MYDLGNAQMFVSEGMDRVRKVIEENRRRRHLCQRDLAFILLTKGQKPKRDAFYDFKGKKLKGEVPDEMNYQFMRRLEKEELVTLQYGQLRALRACLRK